MLRVMWSQTLSPICAALRRGLLQDVEFSSSDPLDPGQHYLLQAIQENEWKHNVTIAGGHSKRYNVNKVFIVIFLSIWICPQIDKHSEIFILAQRAWMQRNTACRFKSFGK